MFLIRLTALAWLCIAPLTAIAQDAGSPPAGLRDALPALLAGNLADRVEAATQIASTGHPVARRLLEALRGGKLYAIKADQRIVIASGRGSKLDITDALTGEALGEISKRKLKKARVNNRLRRELGGLLRGIDLASPSAERRAAAAEALFASRDASVLTTLDAAIERESDDDALSAMRETRAAIVLGSSADPDALLASIDTLKARADTETLAMLERVRDAEAQAEAVREAASDAVSAIETKLALAETAEHLWYGLSLGSVLFLAAVGLAITFGVMGVINMAHGEMVMLGAYTTFVVQSVMRDAAPGLFEWSLLIALPLAFLVSGAAGVAIERGVIRWLYGRPLETLLATFGISLILQQAVRVIFGPTNQQVSNPEFMSGAVDIGLFALTLNRAWIFVFALVVFAALLLLMRRTSFGLEVRAVTQNRAMAGSMGIATTRVDALTFGLGSGIAGVAGVALSQISNVSPNLGQSFIVDSFMVVVFGGVGNLWGTLLGALSLGVINKMIEPHAGAVLAKILVLVFIIAFIQRRPRGLFAQRGRAVES